MEPTNDSVSSFADQSHRYSRSIPAVLRMFLQRALSAPSLHDAPAGAPREYIALVAGIAMLKVLQAAFVAAFSTRFTLGALVCLLVTVADMSLFNIGAAFWGLVVGTVVAQLSELSDFASLRKPRH